MDCVTSFPPAPPRGASLGLDEVRTLCTPVAGPTGDLPARSQVVIVGAGPAGLTAANLLGRLGIETLLLEENASTSALPRAIAVDDEYMRLLESLDLGPAMAGHHSAPFGIWFMGANGTPVVKVAGSTTPNGFGRRAAIMQPVFEKILLAGALRYPSVKVRYATRIDAVSQDDRQIGVEAGGQGVTGDYLLACDGARSFVRERLGIPFAGSRINQPHLVIDLADFPDQSPFSRFFCDPRRPLNSVPSVYGGRRLEFMLNEGDDRDWLLSDAGIQALVDGHSPYAGVPLKIVRRAIYGFAERVAGRLRDGRIFLLGDAAHVMPPFGGQGMNTAARDANNLCWKIAEVLGGRGGDRLLATFDVERKPQIRAVVAYSVRVGKFANVRSRWLASLRDRLLNAAQTIPSVRRYFSEMRYMPRPRITAVAPPERRFASSVGVPFPRLLLSGETVMPIDSIAGDEFCLIGIDVGWPELRAAARHPVFAARPVRLLAIGLNEPDRSHAEPMRRIVDGIPAEIVALRGAICLMRPDRYTAAVATPARFEKALDAVSETLFGHDCNRVPPAMIKTKEVPE